MEGKENLNLILLNAARKVHRADWNWKGVNSPFARMYMVESGEATVVMPDGRHVIRPGKLYLIPSFVTHGYENDSLFTLYYIHVYEEYNVFDRLSFPFEVDASDLDTLLVRRLLAINPGRELARSDPDSYDNMPTLMHHIARSRKIAFHPSVETRGILLQLFARFLERATVKRYIADGRIDQLLQFISENLHRNIPINELANRCYLSNDHLIRLFKKEMHCTPVQYINRKKIDHARLQLIISDRSIKDIAYGLAFENIVYFYRLFKQFVGLSPSRYRDSMAADSQT
ncbi:MAG: AraC family transcriptional regulator [Tannerella sp.]|jgi:AraC-like DNA-binding protein|nr:AraC family transcriptional regulator [Tannerella sp.]